MSRLHVANAGPAAVGQDQSDAARRSARAPTAFTTCARCCSRSRCRDTLTVTPRARAVRARRRAAPGVPADATNLVWRAADALWRALGRDGDPRDAHVTLEKQIPVGGGSRRRQRRCRGRARRAQPRSGSGAGRAAELMRVGGDARRRRAVLSRRAARRLALGRGDELYPRRRRRRGWASSSSSRRSASRRPTPTAGSTRIARPASRPRPRPAARRRPRLGGRARSRSSTTCRRRWRAGIRGSREIGRRAAGGRGARRRR